MSDIEPTGSVGFWLLRGVVLVVLTVILVSILEAIDLPKSRVASLDYGLGIRIQGLERELQ